MLHMPTYKWQSGGKQLNQILHEWTYGILDLNK